TNGTYPKNEHPNRMMNVFYISGTIFFCVSIGMLMGIYSALRQIETHLSVIAGTNNGPSSESSDADG
ncbi:hypothetical protein, partial [Aporhodopirellula aestuarii]